MDFLPFNLIYRALQRYNSQLISISMDLFT